MSELKVILPSSNNCNQRRCLSCGTHEMRQRRRYCSKACRQQMVWVLSLSTGLLKVFNARYAAFSFDSGHVVLDVLPVWANGISRFTYRRTNGKRPAEDLKNLILQSGVEWHDMIHSRASRSYASLCLLRKNQDGTIPPDSILPDRRVRPRLSRREKGYMSSLEMKAEELLSDGHIAKIKSAYRKLAKRYHPDMGGDARKFRELDEAHRQMLLWAKSPQFTTRKALADCWSYDGYTNRWSPPL
jgi:hypothetical protein